MARIYTRTGDGGETALFGGRRVPKDDVRINAIGDVDETNAVLGIVRVELVRGGVSPGGLDDLIATIQHRLFDLGAELAAGGISVANLQTLNEADIAALESAIDEWDATVLPLTEFILPGGSAAAAQMHHARCVCRRAERSVVTLATSEEQALGTAAGGAVRAEVVRYLNRLSDLLFVLARAVNRACGVADVTWKPIQSTRESRS